MRKRKSANLPRPPKSGAVPQRLLKKILAKKSTGIVGKLTATANGYGFVTPERASDGDIFIPARYIEDALDGDIVEAALIDERSLAPQFAGKGRTGRILKVVERHRKTLVGEILPGGQIIPLSKRISQTIQLAGGSRGAKPGDWVEIQLHPSGSGESGIRGKVSSVIGEAGTIAGDLDAVVGEYGLPPPYTEEEERLSAQIEPAVIARETIHGIFCASIDPFDAKDHDDAMSVQAGSDAETVIIGVHIADVAAYIQPGTRWDREAKERSFTAYLPGRTLPMLPRSLTARISLVPGEQCAAQSVYFTMKRKNAEIISVRRAFSWVNISHSFSYDEVQHFIDGGRPESWDTVTVEAMREMIDITRKMRKNRARDEKFLHLAMPELRIVVNEAAGTIAGLENRTQREAETVVEECMLAANGAIAAELHSRQIPAIYRIHTEPDLEKLDTFAANMYESFGLSVGDLSSREACNAFLSSLPDDENRASVMNGFLRALPRALYSEECLPHYGLGKAEYLHFTSPIRRYPDLLVHRQLLALGGCGHLLSTAAMADAARDCTEKEQIVDEAYYAANDRMKLHYLRQVSEAGVDDEWTAVVNRIVPSGVVIEIHAVGLHGMIERQDLVVRRTKSKGKRGGASEMTPLTLSPGDRLKVRVSHIDFTKGTACFAPVS